MLRHCCSSDTGNVAEREGEREKERQNSKRDGGGIAFVVSSGFAAVVDDTLALDADGGCSCCVFDLCVEQFLTLSSQKQTSSNSSNLHNISPATAQQQQSPTQQPPTQETATAQKIESSVERLKS